MRRFVIFLSTILISVSSFGMDSLSVFYRIRLDRDIDKAAERIISYGLEKAVEADADYIILDIDTYGGAVNSADSYPWI